VVQRVTTRATTAQLAQLLAALSGITMLRSTRAPIRTSNNRLICWRGLADLGLALSLLVDSRQ
jgi:hypothetical protein